MGFLVLCCKVGAWLFLFYLPSRGRQSTWFTLAFPPGPTSKFKQPTIYLSCGLSCMLQNNLFAETLRSCGLQRATWALCAATYKKRDARIGVRGGLHFKPASYLARANTYHVATGSKESGPSMAYATNSWRDGPSDRLQTGHPTPTTPDRACLRPAALSNLARSRWWHGAAAPLGVSHGAHAAALWMARL